MDWEEIAKQHLKNEQYYRGLLIEIGEIIGDKAYIAEDGTKSDEVLVAKLPEILRNKYETYLDKIVKKYNNPTDKSNA